MLRGKVNYRLSRRLLADNRSDVMPMVDILVELMHGIPENVLTVDDAYQIMRFVRGDFLYYVHIRGSRCFKVCLYNKTE